MIIIMLLSSTVCILSSTGVRFPSSSRSIYGYFVDMDSGGFLPWDSLVPSTQSLIEKGTVITLGGGEGGDGGRKKVELGDIVTTVDTVRYSFLAGLLLCSRKPVLLTGESGVGKTAVVQNLLSRLETEGSSNFRTSSILGSVLNYTDKNQALLDNISSLTKDVHQGIHNSGHVDLLHLFAHSIFRWRPIVRRNVGWWRTRQEGHSCRIHQHHAPIQRPDNIRSHSSCIDVKTNQEKS